MPKQDFDKKALQLQAIEVIAAVTLENQGKLGEALQYYRKAINYLPENGKLRYSVGVVYMKNSNINEAINEFFESIKYSPEESEAYSALATCYLVQGIPFDEALCLLAFLDLDKDSNKAATIRARLHEFKPEEIVFPVKIFLEYQR